MSDEDEYGEVSEASSTQVSFEAPASLVDRVEAIARVKDEELASVLTEAVRTDLDDAAASKDVRRRVAEWYYDDRLALEQVKQLVGAREAQRLRLLKDDLGDDPLNLKDDLQNRPLEGRGNRPRPSVVGRHHSLRTQVCEVDRRRS